MPPFTTIRRITTNLKTKNTQNCQKIELYGSLVTKNLKKPYSYRQEGQSQGARAEIGSQGRDREPGQRQGARAETGSQGRKDEVWRWQGS